MAQLLSIITHHPPPTTRPPPTTHHSPPNTHHSSPLTTLHTLPADDASPLLRPAARPRPPRRHQILRSSRRGGASRLRDHHHDERRRHLGRLRRRMRKWRWADGGATCEDRGEQGRCPRAADQRRCRAHCRRGEASAHRRLRLWSSNGGSASDRAPVRAACRCPRRPSHRPRSHRPRSTCRCHACGRSRSRRRSTVPHGATSRSWPRLNELSTDYVEAVCTARHLQAYSRLTRAPTLSRVSLATPRDRDAGSKRHFRLVFSGWPI